MAPETPMVLATTTHKPRVVPPSTGMTWRERNALHMRNRGGIYQPITVNPLLQRFLSMGSPARASTAQDSGKSETMPQSLVPIPDRRIDAPTGQASKVGQSLSSLPSSSNPSTSFSSTTTASHSQSSDGTIPVKRLSDSGDSSTSQLHQPARKKRKSNITQNRELGSTQHEVPRASDSDPPAATHPIIPEAEPVVSQVRTSLSARSSLSLKRRSFEAIESSIVVDTPSPVNPIPSSPMAESNALDEVLPVSRLDEVPDVPPAKKASKKAKKKLVAPLPVEENVGADHEPSQGSSNLGGKKAGNPTIGPKRKKTGKGQSLSSKQGNPKSKDSEGLGMGVTRNNGDYTDESDIDTPIIKSKRTAPSASSSSTTHSSSRRPIDLKNDESLHGTDDDISLLNLKRKRTRKPTDPSAHNSSRKDPKALPPSPVAYNYSADDQSVARIAQPIAPKVKRKSKNEEKTVISSKKKGKKATNQETTAANERESERPASPVLSASSSDTVHGSQATSSSTLVDSYTPNSSQDIPPPILSDGKLIPLSSVQSSITATKSKPKSSTKKKSTKAKPTSKGKPALKVTAASKPKPALKAKSVSKAKPASKIKSSLTSDVKKGKAKTEEASWEEMKARALAMLNDDTPIFMDIDEDEPDPLDLLRT